MELYVLREVCDVTTYYIDDKEYSIDDICDLLNEDIEVGEENEFYVRDDDMDYLTVESIYADKYGCIVACLRESMEEVLETLKEDY